MAGGGIIREEVIGKARLLLGDCREILPSLARVDAVVTDVPYAISEGQLEGGGWVGRKTSGGLRKLSYGEWDAASSGDVAYEALALCSAVPTVLAFCEYRQLSRIYEILTGRSCRTVAWLKTNPTVMNGDRLFLPALEVGFYGKLPSAWFGGHCVKSVWTGPTERNRVHPTQKPLGLMKWAVENVVAPDGVCCDPFMGSGTTGVACAHLDRDFIGIETDEQHFEAAVRRIREANGDDAGPLFVEAA